MFGLIRTFIYFVIIIASACCFFAWHYRVPATSYLLSTLLNNPVTIGDVDVSLSLSSINGKDVGIVNPPRSRDAEKHAIVTRVFEFKLPFINWFKKTLVIEDIVLDRVDFIVDMYNVIGTQSNVKTIIGNVKARALERHPEGKKNKRPVIIERILLRDIHFSYRNPFLTAGVTELPRVKQIEITNVGTGHPVSAAQIATLITTTLLRHFASLSGFTDILKTVPQLPLIWFKNIFIRKGAEAAVSLESFLQLPATAPESKGFFKKIFGSSRRDEEEY